MIKVKKISRSVSRNTDGSSWEYENYPAYNDKGTGEEWLNKKQISLEDAKALVFQISEEAYDYEDEINEAKDIEELQDALLELKEYQQDNTYNSSWWGGVIDFGVLTDDSAYGEALMILRMHRGGDPRGNYNEYEMFQLDSWAEDVPMYADILNYYIETEKGDIVLDSDDFEGYNLRVVSDETGTFEEDDYVSLDEIEEKFDLDGNSMYNRGGIMTADSPMDYAEGGEIIKQISTHKAVRNGDKIDIISKGFEIGDLKYSDEVLYSIPTENEEDLMSIFNNLQEEIRILLAQSNVEFSKGGEVKASDIVGAKPKEDIYGTTSRGYDKIYKQSESIGNSGKNKKEVQDILNSEDAFNFNFYDKYGNEYQSDEISKGGSTYAEGGKLKKFFGKAKEIGGKAYEKGRGVAHYTKEAAKESMHKASKRNAMGVLSNVKGDRNVSNEEVDNIEETEDIVQEHYTFEPTAFVPKKAKGGEIYKKPRLKKGDQVYIYGKTWFQKSYGNTYHITKVYVNNEIVGISEIQYGYGEQYVQTGMDILWNNFLPPYKWKMNYSSWRLKDFGIKIQTEETEVTRERELNHTNYGKGGNISYDVQDLLKG
tara:strand:+ start:9688 stop:11475 length:1788 start_codon:yes stop_codon:yes gene_type:complete